MREDSFVDTTQKGLLLTEKGFPLCLREFFTLNSFFFQTTSTKDALLYLPITN